MFDTHKLKLATEKIFTSCFCNSICTKLKIHMKSLFSSSPVVVQSQLNHIYTALFDSGKKGII